MKIQPVTSKTKAAYPMLAKAAAITAIAAASLISANALEEDQDVTGAPPRPESQAEDTTPASQTPQEQDPQRTPNDVEGQDVTGEAPIWDEEEQDLGGDVAVPSVREEEEEEE